MAAKKKAASAEARRASTGRQGDGRGPAPGRRRTATAKPAASRRSAQAGSRARVRALELRSVGPSLTVGDIERSLGFYRDVLGFTTGEHWVEDGRLAGVDMIAGQVHFWLTQDDWKKGRDRVKGEGFRLYCETAQDVDRLAERIEAAGATLLEPPHDEPWGGRALAVADPDGFKITIARTRDAGRR